MALCGTGSADVNCLCGLGRVNQGSIFAATIRTAEPPTLSDQAGVRVLDARIAGIVSPDSLAQKKQQRQRPLFLCCLGHGVELTPASMACAHLAAQAKWCSAACCMCGDCVPFSIWDRLEGRCSGESTPTTSLIPQPQPGRHSKSSGHNVGHKERSLECFTRSVHCI
jgi:hypothetical protein